ncbi:MAG: leucyl aminopeptidase [Anaerolineae bacterium]|nr:leucyl aminopeptidase [Anaerolineae bacterium]
MEIKTYTMPIAESDADVCLIYAFEDNPQLIDITDNLDRVLNGAIRDVIATGDFTGKSGQITIFYPRGAVKTKRIILVGLGKQDSLTPDSIRRAVGTGIRRARELKAGRVATVITSHPKINPVDVARAVVEAALLSAYKYHGQKSDNTGENFPTALDIHVPVETDDIQQGIKIGLAFASGAIMSRDMVNLPPNICTPIYIASMARNMADGVGLKTQVFDRDTMDELRMGAVLAVAQGSANPPRFIILEHNADQADTLDTVVLVGKGVTFDTGGYSIKTAEGMVGMKADMSGAAAVIGAMQTIAMLNLPLHVVGLAPAAENMISSNAYRPQDVITASNGKTIEIISTDAEGRLLLADALVYANRYKPKAVVDIATLTGACVVALGPVAAGFFCTDAALRDKLLSAADATQEKLWELPLFPEYKKALESDTADLKNTGGRNGGVGTSAVFLQQFTDYPAWAHIDMAGVMSDVADNPYVPPKGGSGYGARLLAEFAKQWAEQK